MEAETTRSEVVDEPDEFRMVRACRLGLLLVRALLRPRLPVPPQGGRRLGKLDRPPRGPVPAVVCLTNHDPPNPSSHRANRLSSLSPGEGQCCSSQATASAASLWSSASRRVRVSRT